jgi:hypothetical protein
MSNDDEDARKWADLSQEERDELRELLRERARSKQTKPRFTRLVGSLLGSILPDGLVDVSKLGDEPREREFKEGFAEGRLARGLGEVLTSQRKPKKEDEP